MVPEGLGDVFDALGFLGPVAPWKNRGAPLEKRESSPKLETRVERALHVRQLPIGDAAARCYSITASVMLLINSSAVLAKEFFHTNYTYLAVMCSTLFTCFVGVDGAKMVIDGVRECRECLRTTGGKRRDCQGAWMTANRVVEGTIMLGIAGVSLVSALIYLKRAVGLYTPNLWIGDLLQTLSSVTFGVYTVFEWIGSLLESRKFFSLRKELRSALGEGGDDYEGAINYLKGSVELSKAEVEGLSEKQIIALKRAKEDLFSLFWGRELMLNVRDVNTLDKAKVEAIVKEAITWNREWCWVSLFNFLLLTVAIAVVVVCFVTMGGLPVIETAVVMCTLSLTLNIINTCRIFMYFKSKEIGVWDERLLMIGMGLVVAAMVASVALVGGGPVAIAIFSVTGGFILLLKAITLYKIHQLRKEREVQVKEAEGIELREVEPSTL